MGQKRCARVFMGSRCDRAAAPAHIHGFRVIPVTMKKPDMLDWASAVYPHYRRCRSVNARIFWQEWLMAMNYD